MSNYTDTLWGEISPLFDAIIEHPFLRELCDGSLSTERFTFYVQQDSLYLLDFARGLAALAVRAKEGEATYQFATFAKETFEVEQSLHETFFTQFAITDPTARRSPTCFSYGNFLKASVAYGSFEEAVGALLPCFWIYQEVGNAIVRRARGTGANNPYQRWIDTYSGEEFGASVAKMLSITNRVAAEASEKGRRELRSAFLTACRLEYLFWDSAYRLERWQPEAFQPADWER